MGSRDLRKSLPHPKFRALLGVLKGFSRGALSTFIRSISDDLIVLSLEMRRKGWLGQ
ncbi:hypothetical protein AG1IA_06265 [Rhizoctonia solani AG-1 IA]|uniref:Uncharacterized protein n=1 Tax=Thanatephorus cucumeris (strain AG1-IA) TaxID=983506 RepID=L8WTL7_THACA|nr:hypothetical protein AG1IA_06265 [Rhizoctonia solani AG-1 IA]